MCSGVLDSHLDVLSFDSGVQRLVFKIILQEQPSHSTMFYISTAIVFIWERKRAIINDKPLLGEGGQIWLHSTAQCLVALIIKLTPSAGCTHATALLLNYLNTSVPASKPSLLKVPPTSQISFRLPSTLSEKGIKELTPTI